MNEKQEMIVPSPIRSVCSGCGKERSIPVGGSWTSCSCGSSGVRTESLVGVVAPLDLPPAA